VEGKSVRLKENGYGLGRGAPIGILRLRRGERGYKRVICDALDKW